MIAHINAMFLQSMDFAKVNPIIASAFGLWGLSVISFLVRDVPRSIVEFVVYHTTTVLELNSQDPVYYDFLDWLSKNKLHSYVRTLNFNNRSSKRYYGIYSEATSPMSIGYGRMFFRHGWRLFAMTRKKDSSTQTEMVKEVITLRVLGRSQAVFQALFTAAQQKIDSDALYTKVYLHTKDNGWEMTCRQLKRSFDTIALPIPTSNLLTRTIDMFLSDNSWYAKNGVPYRLGILLEGPPGTGKTSLIKGLCAKYGRDLYLLSLSIMTDASLLEALSKVPEGSIVAIEDIDAQGTVVNRDDKKDAAKGPTLSGLLNALDGAVSAENRILIATTNHPDRLDPALIREGRFDLRLAIGNMDTETFHRYMASMYEDFTPIEGFEIAPNTSTAKVQRLVFENKTSYLPVIETLRSNSLLIADTAVLLKQEAQ